MDELEELIRSAVETPEGKKLLLQGIEEELKAVFDSLGGSDKEQRKKQVIDFVLKIDRILLSYIKDKQETPSLKEEKKSKFSIIDIE